MSYLLSKMIAKIILGVNYILDKIFKKKNLRFYIYEILRENYIEKIINGKKTLFFCPGTETKRRTESIFTKEPETIKFIDNFDKNIEDRKKDLIFFDIGTNIGLYSIYASQKINNIKVFSFEPSFQNLSILSKNVGINNLSNKISILPFSLTENNNKVPFFSSEFYETKDKEGGAINYFGNLNNLFVDENNMDKALIYKTFGTNLDYLIEENIVPIPDAIKIDTDGQELKILRGSKNLLKSCENLKIQIELDEKNINDFKEIVKMLELNGFKFINKLRNDNYHKNIKFSEVYNYLFEKKDKELNVN